MPETILAFSRGSYARLPFQQSLLYPSSRLSRAENLALFPKILSGNWETKTALRAFGTFRSDSEALRPGARDQTGRNLA